MNAFNQYRPCFSRQSSWESVKQESYLDTMDYPFYQNLTFTNEETPVIAPDHRSDTMRAMLSVDFAEAVPSLQSSHSNPSIGSASSSITGSPHFGYAQPMINASMYWSQQELLSTPAMADDGIFQLDSIGYVDENSYQSVEDNKLANTFNDPVLVLDHSEQFFQPTMFATSYAQPQIQLSPLASPVTSPQTYQPYEQTTWSSQPMMRRPSLSPSRSTGSPRASHSGDEDGNNRKRCLECGREFKDLKAHMLTHELERPEKCPIPSCEYFKKGFARRYDRNRHTLTHYRGTMVCGFCPGSGSAQEKSFNRADVFKRHLVNVHKVEQTAPNSRKRSPGKSSVTLSSYCQDATGKCSACNAQYNNAQDFYEHLDECVLRIVQKEQPSEANNKRLLDALKDDADLAATFERNQISIDDNSTVPLQDDSDEDDSDTDDDELEMMNDRSGRGTMRPLKTMSQRAVIGGNVSKKSRRGLTWSKGGGSIIGKSRKRRKFYPPSWGMSADKRNMKKRVICVYDGQRRLLKDDMMMNSEFEVRMPLLDGTSYVTDVDVVTMDRAEAFHNATAEEKGPWYPEAESEDYQRQR